MFRLWVVCLTVVLSFLGYGLAQDEPSSWLDVNPSIYIPPSSVDPPFSTSSEAVTSTVESRPVITTIAVPWSLSTAAAAEGSVKKGDLLIEFSDSFKSHLIDTAKSACGAPGKRDVPIEDRELKPRAAACQNMASFVSRTVGDGAPGGLDIISFSKPITAHDMEARVRKFFAAGRALYKSRLFISGAVIVWLGLYLDGKNTDANEPLVIPSNNLGDATGKVASDLPTSTGTGSSSCKTTKTGKSAPICEDTSGCNGMAKKTCEVENNEDHLCPCYTLADHITHVADPPLITAQQQILQTIQNSPTPAPSSGPACFHGGQPVDEDGPTSVQRLPTDWCNCGTKTYSVATTSGNPCPDDVTSGKEVTFTTSTSAEPTTTHACVTGPYKPTDWVIPRDDMIKAADAYCEHTVQSQNNGAKVANNWPGACAWVFDGDVKKMAASIRGSSYYPNIPNVVVDLDSCKDSLHQAIDGCDISQPPPNNKRGGTHGEKWPGYAAEDEEGSEAYDPDSDGAP